MVKKKQKIEIRDIIKKITNKCSRFTMNTWYFTVTFFVIIFIASIWVWWNCYYDPKPSSDVVISFEAKKEDFESMKNKTEKAISLLQEKRSNYFNVPDLSLQRELFMEKPEEEEEVVESDMPIVVPEPEIKAEEEPKTQFDEVVNQ